MINYSFCIVCINKITFMDPPSYTLVTSTYVTCAHHTTISATHREDSHVHKCSYCLHILKVLQLKLNSQWFPFIMNLNLKSLDIIIGQDKLDMETFSLLTLISILQHFRQHYHLFVTADLNMRQRYHINLIAIELVQSHEKVLYCRWCLCCHF